jgi:hypothetical protein
MGKHTRHLMIKTKVFLKTRRSLLWTINLIIVLILFWKLVFNMTWLWLILTHKGLKIFALVIFLVASLCLSVVPKRRARLAIFKPSILLVGLGFTPWILALVVLAYTYNREVSLWVSLIVFLLFFFCGTVEAKETSGNHCTNPVGFGFLLSCYLWKYSFFWKS